MKKTLLITDLDFWKADIGSRQRILKMVQYLNIYTNITILYLKKITKTDKEKILKLNLQNVVSLLDTKIIQSDLESTCITKTKFLENFYSHDLKTRFIKYLSLNHYDNLIIEYIKLDYLLNDIHDIYCTIVDTHDLMSRRTISYSKYNEKPSIVFENLKQEIDILKHYDYVLSIQKNEYETLINEIEKNKILLVQHAVDINQKSHIKQKVKNIVFVSGPANLQHIVWFIKNIWIYFQDNKTVHLNIYGTVCSKLQNFKNYKQLYLKGPVEYLDDIYKDADIVINPVLYGSGLKIKNVEALSYGLPLITTYEGSNGIEDGIGRAYLLANNKDEWIEALLTLIISNSKREILSSGAFEYANKNFNDVSCYQKVVNVLKNDTIQ